MTEAAKARSGEAPSSDRTLLWVFLATGARAAYGLAAIALASRRYGLEAVGDLGQLLSILALLTQLSTFGLGRGVTARHAMYLADPRRLERTNAAIVTIAAVSFATAMVLLSGAYAGGLYASLFASDGLNFTAFILIIQLPLTVGGALLQAISAAHGHSRRASHIVCASSVVSIAILLLLVLRNSPFETYVTATLLQPGFTMVMLALGLRSHLIQKYRIAARSISDIFRRELPDLKIEVRHLLQVAVAIAVPLVLNLVIRIMTRLLLRDGLGATAVGQWETITRIQDGYLQFLGAALALVLLPRLITAQGNAASLERAYILGFSGLFILGACGAAVVGDSVLSAAFGGAAAGGASLLILATLMDVARSSFMVIQYGNLAIGRARRFLMLEMLSTMSLLAASAIGVYVLESLTGVFIGYIAAAIMISVVAIQLRKSDVR